MRFLLPVLALSLSSAAIAGPVEVTHFHAGQPIPQTNVAIVPADGGDAQALEFRAYAGAVARELAQLGYAEGGTAPTPLIAEIQYSRGVRTDFVRSSPVSIGIGTGTFGRHFGFGLGTSFPVGGGGGPRETMVTKMIVVLKNRADGKPVWEGRAETAARAGTPAAQANVTFDKLAAAMFKGFPGKSGETITVR